MSFNRNEIQLQATSEQKLNEIIKAIQTKYSELEDGINHSQWFCPAIYNLIFSIGLLIKTVEAGRVVELKIKNNLFMAIKNNPYETEENKIRLVNDLSKVSNLVQGATEIPEEYIPIIISNTWNPKSLMSLFEKLSWLTNDSLKVISLHQQFLKAPGLQVPFFIPQLQSIAANRITVIERNTLGENAESKAQIHAFLNKKINFIYGQRSVGTKQANNSLFASNLDKAYTPTDVIIIYNQYMELVRKNNLVAPTDMLKKAKLRILQLVLDNPAAERNVEVEAFLNTHRKFHFFKNSKTASMVVYDNFFKSFASTDKKDALQKKLKGKVAADSKKLNLTWTRNI